MESNKQFEDHFLKAKEFLTDEAFVGLAENDYSETLYKYSNAQLQTAFRKYVRLHSNDWKKIFKEVYDGELPIELVQVMESLQSNADKTVMYEYLFSRIEEVVSTKMVTPINFCDSFLSNGYTLVMAPVKSEEIVMKTSVHQGNDEAKVDEVAKTIVYPQAEIEQEYIEDYAQNISLIKNDRVIDVQIINSVVIPSPRLQGYNLNPFVAVTCGLVTSLFKLTLKGFTWAVQANDMQALYGNKFQRTEGTDGKIILQLGMIYEAMAKYYGDGMKACNGKELYVFLYGFFSKYVKYAMFASNIIRVNMMPNLGREFYTIFSAITHKKIFETLLEKIRHVSFTCIESALPWSEVLLDKEKIMQKRGEWILNVTVAKAIRFLSVSRKYRSADNRNLSSLTQGYMYGMTGLSASLIAMGGYFTSFSQFDFKSYTDVVIEPVNDYSLQAVLYVLERQDYTGSIIVVSSRDYPKNQFCKTFSQYKDLTADYWADNLSQVDASKILHINMNCINRLKECDISVGAKILDELKTSWISITNHVKGKNNIHRIYASFLSPVIYTDEIKYMMSHEPHNLQIWCMSSGVKQFVGLEETPFYWKFRDANALRRDYPVYSVLANIERNSSYCDSRYEDLCNFMSVEPPKMRCIFPPAINYRDKELININIDEMSLNDIKRLKQLIHTDFGVEEIVVATVAKEHDVKEDALKVNKRVFKTRVVQKLGSENLMTEPISDMEGVSAKVEDPPDPPVEVKDPPDPQIPKVIDNPST